MNKYLPLNCPSCGSILKVKSMECNVCETTITGLFELPSLTKLSFEEQKFVLNFILSNGSLKELAAKMKLSYPTVRNMLDDIITHLIKAENDNK
jgi:hypothetical protein